MSWCNDVKITEEQIKFYHDHGYVVIDNVLDHEKCDELQRLAEPFADEDYSVVLNIHRKSTEFLEMTRDPTIVGNVKSVQNSDISGLNSQYLFKKCVENCSK